MKLKQETQAEFLYNIACMSLSLSLIKHASSNKLNK